MEYFKNYRDRLFNALNCVDEIQLKLMETHLTYMAKNEIPLIVCGNGGSAAITEHFSCDHTKAVAMETSLKPFVIPLQSNVSLITAIANDIGYEYIFSKQIEWIPSNNFGLLIISSSGNSPNIINAIKAAQQKGVYITMAMVGFNGGEAKNLVDVCVHVPSVSYGIVEDAHQIIMHSLADSIRQKNYTL